MDSTYHQHQQIAVNPSPSLQSLERGWGENFHPDYWPLLAIAILLALFWASSRMRRQWRIWTRGFAMASTLLVVPVPHVGPVSIVFLWIEGIFGGLSWRILPVVGSICLAVSLFTFFYVVVFERPAWMK